MKKMFVLIALCAMASSLMAVNFTDENFKNGALTVPVVYTGMLKINGWGDEGLCYNWQQTRNSYPLFLGLCQPCLDCVPCDIDMRHKDPTVQYGANIGNGPANADPNGRLITDGNNDNIDQTEAFFNRARLYIVNDIKTGTRTATVKVVDLIDAYWGKDGQSATAVLFQFFNTVDSMRRANTNGLYGRLGAMYQFPIYSRDFLRAEAVATGAYYSEMTNVRLNEYNRDAAVNGQGHTNTHTPANAQAAAPCVADRTEDGIGLAALIGVKDYKAFFRLAATGQAYPIVTIKAFTGDFFAWQYNYTDNDYDNVVDAAGNPVQPQYVCRKGEEYVAYKGVREPPAGQDPHYDGKGAWYATGNITLRRNDAVTRRMMADLNQGSTSVSCIPCGRSFEAPSCREYLDSGVVSYLIERQFSGWTLTYLVDLDNDGIYGETADCGRYLENFTVTAEDVRNGRNSYLAALVNVDATTEGSSANNYYELRAGAAAYDLANSAATSAGRVLETTAHTIK